MVDVADDDHVRLLRLLSLVFKVDGPGVGIRFVDEHQRLEWFEHNKSTVERIKAVLARGGSVEEAVDPEWGHFSAAFHQAGSYFKDALNYRSGDTRYAQDVQQLPMFVLEAIGQVTDRVRAMLGQMVLHSLRLREVADSQRLAQLWLDDVAATSWHLLLKHQDIGNKRRRLDERGGDL